MGRITGEQASELEGVLHEAAGQLSPAHVAAMVAHPDAVCSVLAGGEVNRVTKAAEGDLQGDFA